MMTTDPDLDPAARAARRAEARRAAKWRERRSWVVLGLTLIVAVVVLWQQLHISTVTACQAQFNEAFARNIVQRAALTDQDRQSTQELIEAVFKPPPASVKTQAERAAYFRRVFARYEGTQARIKSVRASKPFPQLPSKACR